jgi:mono/diheme cytochrome c family protein
MVVFVGTTSGWYFFRGPGRSWLGHTPKPNAEVVAEGTKPEETKVVPPVTERKEPPPPSPPQKPMPPTPPPALASAPPVSKQPTSMITFSKHMRPIFEAKCISCHGGGKQRGGLDMRSVASLLRGGDSGSSLKPGVPDRSLLVETVNTNRMPPTPNKLTQAERKMLREWIAGGAKE